MVEDSDLNPPGNTGLLGIDLAPTAISAKLDTLVLCGEGITTRRIFDLIDRLLNCQFDTTRDYATSHGMKYAHNLHAQLGLLLSYNTNDFDNRIQYRLSITGSICSATPYKNLVLFLQTMRRWGAHATRFDWAMDDYRKLLQVSDYKKLADEDCYHGARTSRYFHTQVKGGIDRGSTVYIGAVGGTQQLCVYDKFIESKGKIDAIRLEYRFYDQKADYFFYLYTNDSTQAASHQQISKYCMGRIGFCQSELVTGISYAYLRLWDELISQIGEKLSFTLPKKPTTIESKKEWISHSVAPTLAMISTTMSYHKFVKWLLNLVRAATKKLKPSQIGELKYLKEWELLNRFGTDFDYLKHPPDTDYSQSKSIETQSKLPTSKVCSTTRIEKLPSCQRPITLMEQLSLVLPTYTYGFTNL